jgi:hypothetical protein
MRTDHTPIIPLTFIPQRHHEVYEDDDNKGQNGKTEGWIAGTVFAVIQFSRVEISRHCSLFADFLFDDKRTRIIDICLARLACGGLCARKPPQSERQCDERRDDAQAGSREGCSSEVGHRNRIVR